MERASAGDVTCTENDRHVAMRYGAPLPAAACLYVKVSRKKVVHGSDLRARMDTKRQKTSSQSSAGPADTILVGDDFSDLLVSSNGGWRGKHGPCGGYRKNQASDFIHLVARSRVQVLFQHERILSYTGRHEEFSDDRTGIDAQCLPKFEYAQYTISNKRLDSRFIRGHQCPKTKLSH